MKVISAWQPGLTMRIYHYLSDFMFLALSLCLVSCASTRLPSIDPDAPLKMEKDERQIWENAEQLERKIDKSGLLYKNDQLEAYLNAIVLRLFSQQSQQTNLTPRIKVIQDSFLNAFALPHGVIYIHTPLCQ